MCLCPYLVSVQVLVHILLSNQLYIFFATHDFSDELQCFCTVILLLRFYVLLYEGKHCVVQITEME